ncbi:hypothetical protein A8C32_17310 [Flavivirga aquatica]|uniref:Uncharacterized protein n=1 Tax=Flavivirga aquatica TaxID=1849968 RepID=A0A1E5T848_9FLAO|nr:hypothetical protein [Flavivirga aquatica]OEK07555.1 hypothetical protein A8C32_17310 [Flavivirga aquatica]
MKTPIFTITLLIVTSLFSSSCDSDDSPTDPKNNNQNVDFKEALLLSFPLSEIDITLKADGISIEQPTMINGVPQNKGKITIELEYNEISKFSLKQVDFDDSKFNISPNVGEKDIIPGETITYRITSTKDTNISLEYDVLIITKDIAPALQKLNITGLHFLKSDNLNLNEDITSIEVREHTNQSYNGTIMVTVPNGTNFSDLTPKLDFEGSSIHYTSSHYGTHPNFEVYTQGSSIDFKFPNIIAFRVYNSDETNYREYRVLVDVKKLITFDEESVTLNNGNIISHIHTFDNALGFTYHGNYPINSKLTSSKIEVTKTPETPSKNYYFENSIRLMENNPTDSNNEIQTGERGKLYIELNFPGNFVSNTTSGISSYIVDVMFNPMLESYATPSVTKTLNNNTGALKDLNFLLLYDPIKIELKANVYTTAL